MNANNRPPGPRNKKKSRHPFHKKGGKAPGPHNAHRGNEVKKDNNPSPVTLEVSHRNPISHTTNEGTAGGSKPLTPARHASGQVHSHRRHNPSKRNAVIIPASGRSPSHTSSSRGSGESQRHGSPKRFDPRASGTRSDKRPATIQKEPPGERRVNTANLNIMELPSEAERTVETEEKRPLKKYGVLFYDTYTQAKKDAENLKSKHSAFDQLNIVVREEGNMDDPELRQFGKIFSGTAWYHIHERRVNDHWYESQQE